MGVIEEMLERVVTAPRRRSGGRVTVLDLEVEDSKSTVVADEEDLCGEPVFEVATHPG